MPAVSALAAALLLAVATPPQPQPLLTLSDPALLESSGLAVSAVHRDVLWTHADGGTVAQVRAVDRGGDTVAVVTLAGIDPYDPEALAPGTATDGTHELYLGDIGDNSAVRSNVSVFRFAEPAALRDQSVAVQWYRFAYPDGPHDAEALLVHPRTGRIFIVTKELGTGGVYRAPRDLVTHDVGVNRLERVSDAPVLVTDGAFLPDGRLVLRTYSSVYLYDRPGEQVAVDPLPAQPQGESLAVDGDRLLVGSEGENAAVYAVGVPVDTAEGARDRSGPRPGRREEGPPASLLVGGLVGVLAGLGIWWRARRRVSRRQPRRPR